MSPFRWEAVDTQNCGLFEQVIRSFHSEDERQLPNFTDRLQGTLLQVRYNDIPSVAYPTVLSPFGYRYRLYFLQPTVLTLSKGFFDTKQVTVILPTIRICNQGDCFTKAGINERELHSNFRGDIIGGHLTFVSIAPDDYPKLYELYIRGLSAIRQSREGSNYDRNGEQVVRGLAYSTLRSDGSIHFTKEEDFDIKNIVKHHESRHWGDRSSYPQGGVGRLQGVLSACTLRNQRHYDNLFRSYLSE